MVFFQTANNALLLETLQRKITEEFLRILVWESLTEKRIKEIGTICFVLVNPKKKTRKYETRLAVKKAGLFILVSQQHDK